MFLFALVSASGIELRMLTTLYRCKVKAIQSRRLSEEINLKEEGIAQLNYYFFFFFHDFLAIGFLFLFFFVFDLFIRTVNRLS